MDLILGFCFAVVLVYWVFPLSFTVITKHLHPSIKVAAIKYSSAMGAICAVITLYFFKRRLVRKLATNRVCQFFKECAADFIESETYGRCYNDVYKVLVSHNGNVRAINKRVNFFRGERQ